MNQVIVGETYREKATRKFRENPFVPVGALATTAALVVAMVKMRRGQSRSFNNWLRVRVLAQGLTICAVVVGTYSFGSRVSGGNPVEADLERRREEKLVKDRQEFEERLKSAVEMHDEMAGRGAVADDGTSTGPRTAREKLEEKLRSLGRS